MHTYTASSIMFRKKDYVHISVLHNFRFAIKQLIYVVCVHSQLVLKGILIHFGFTM